MNCWTGEQRAFAIKAYYKNNDSFIAAQRLFRLHYNIHRNDPVPSAHTARCSMDAVRRLFPTHIVSRYGDIAWPARSPDLTPCDFFLMGIFRECGV